MSGYPFPSVIIIIAPAAIMKSGPSPWIVRNPGIAIICYNPVAIGGIGPKSVFGIGYPNVTICWVINPGTVRIQFIVKLLVRNILTLLCPGVIWSGQHYQKCY